MSGINLAVFNYRSGTKVLTSAAINGVKFTGEDAVAWAIRVGQLVKEGQLKQVEKTNFSRVYRPVQQPRKRPWYTWSFKWDLTGDKTEEGRAIYRNKANGVLCTRRKAKGGKMYHKAIA